MVESMGASAASIQSILNNIRDIRQGFDEVHEKNSIGHIDNSQSNDTFEDTFQKAIKSVSDSQIESSNLKTAFEVGDPSVSLEQVTIASQQASIGFEAMLQVRNKLVDAYKDIMNMPV